MCAAPAVLVGGQPSVPGMLASWAEGLSRSRAGRRGRGVLRFAFYGRVLTEDWQEPESSRARQLQQAVMLTAGVGMIVAVFFDAGRAGRWRGRGARKRPLWWPRSRIRSAGGMRL